MLWILHAYPSWKCKMQASVWGAVVNKLFRLLFQWRITFTHGIFCATLGMSQSRFSLGPMEGLGNCWELGKSPDKANFRQMVSAENRRTRYCTGNWQAELKDPLNLEAFRKSTNVECFGDR